MSGIPYPTDYSLPPESDELTPLEEILEDEDLTVIMRCKAGIERLEDQDPDLIQSLHDFFYGDEPHKIDYDWLLKETLDYMGLQ